MKNIVHFGLRTVLALTLAGTASTQLAACASDVDVPGMPAADGGAQQPPADAGMQNPPADNGPRPIVCGDRLVSCSNVCCDLTRDGNNCGGCGNVCGAGTTCVNSVCTPTQRPPTCAAGQMDCGSTCRALQTDALNCGTCGHACAAGQNCTAGTCTTPAPTCPGVNTATDVNNCGRCGNRCAAGESCNSGMCTSPTEDSYEYTVTAPRQMMSITLDDFWGGSHSVANYLDPGRNRMLTTHTMSFRVPRGTYIALNDTFVYDSSGRNVTVFGCAVERVGGPFVTTGNRTLRRNGVTVVMTVTGDNMGRDGCNFEAADRPAPWR